MLCPASDNVARRSFNWTHNTLQGGETVLTLVKITSPKNKGKYKIRNSTRNAPDLVVGPKADPLGDLPVLASLLGQDLLDLEGLVGRLHKNTHSKISSLEALRTKISHATKRLDQDCQYPHPVWTVCTICVATAHRVCVALT